MTIRRLFMAGWLSLAVVPLMQAADLVLLDQGKSDYQIVVPDRCPAPEVAQWLDLTAQLVQDAFKANGAEVPIAKEASMNPGKPAIYLGDTAFARAHGVDVSKFLDWTYVLKAVGRDVIVAGNDQRDSDTNGAHGVMCRLGTAKGATDFLRQYAGTRFLWPGFKMAAQVQRTDGVMDVSSNGTEFLKVARIAIPGDLDLVKKPIPIANFDYERETFYDIALNLFPLLGGRMDVHSYNFAIPAEKYRDTHPEYFALINGKRCCTMSTGKSNHPWVEQYCISNPDVQELIYKRALARIDAGNEITSVGQPDGFQPCQCTNCFALYGTGNDWNEKLWIFHRKLAERLQQERPGRKMALMCYMNTAKAPKSFKKFPASAVLSVLGDSSEEGWAEWKDLDLPGGFIAIQHTWGGFHMASSYTPVRTPSYVAGMVQRMTAHNVCFIRRDGAIGYCWGLEAPVYYTFGRMFDDPSTNNAAQLVDEFCTAAFGRARAPMLQFYTRLYKQIGVYSDMLGTHCPGWGLAKAQENFNFSIIGYLYSPDFLASAEKDLRQAETLADSQRVKARLSLIRLEFDYVKGLATIVHLYQAFQLRPTQASRDVLLDAIDAWHAVIDNARVLNKRGNLMPLAGWPDMFPFSGHPRPNVALEINQYQNFFKDTCVNWDTAAMRKTPLASGQRKMTATRRAGPPTVADWTNAVGECLIDLKDGGVAGRAGGTTFAACHDRENLYLRIEASDTSVLLANGKSAGRDGRMDGQECLHIFLAPLGERSKYYHFVVGPLSNSVYDARCGFIEDTIDPRYGKDDATWNGEWRYETLLDLARKSKGNFSSCPWRATLTIPFKTLGALAPAAGTVWQMNVGRQYVPQHYKPKDLIWSWNAECNTLADPRAFGDLVFGE